MMLPQLLIVFSGLVSSSGGSDVVLGVLGQSAFIECQLPVSNTLVWQTENGNVIAINGRVTNENSTKYAIDKQNGFREFLVVHDLTLADDNLIRCVDLKNSSNVDTTQLTVLVRPPRMNATVSPPPPLLEGSKVTFTCDADGGKPLPEIKWFLQSSNGSVAEVYGNITDLQYTNDTGYRRNTLELNVTRDLYQSTFICNITVPLLYQETLTVDTDVLLAPLQSEIESRDYDGSFDENSRLELECTSEGSRPAPNIYWLLNGNRVGDVEVVVIPSENGTFTVKSKLKMIMSRDYNGSVLTCAVTNKVLQDQGLPPRTANIILLASYKPVLSLEQKEYATKLGHNVTLRCHIDANPLPKLEHLYWTHKGAMLDRKYYALSNGSDVFSLALQDVKISDSGKYSCRAINRLGASTSEQIKLSILYAPVCENNAVKKIAIKRGDIGRLNCSMLASPNDVIFTWRYKKTDERISTLQGVVDMRSDDSAYSTLERTMGTWLRYAEIECYGSNTEGESTSPCSYQLLPPGPPETPTNCSTLVEGSQVQISCAAGFDGGSPQHFILQKLGGFEFETLLTGDTPDFAFHTYMNVTIRVCTFNDDYNSIKNCATPSSVTVDVTGQPQSDSVKGKNSHKSAYIAGGVVASLGIIIIAVIVALLLFRRYKKGKKARNNNDLESGLETDAYRSNKFTTWWKSVSLKKFAESFRKGKTDQPVAGDVRDRDVVTELDENEAPYQDIGRLASTPYRPIQFYRIDRNVNCSVFNISSGQTVEEDKQIAPDVLNESTGFALSPIVARNAGVRCSFQTDNSIKYQDGVIDTPSLNDYLAETTDVGISNCYNTEDMLDVLCDSDARGLTRGVETETSVNVNVKTLNKEYTNGDIADVLDGNKDDFEKENQNTKDINEIEAQVNEGNSVASRINETGDFCDSHTVMKFMNVDFSDVLSETETASKINHINAESFFDSAEETFDNFMHSGSLAMVSKIDKYNSDFKLDRARSLPYRSRKQRHITLKKVNSLTDLKSYVKATFTNTTETDTAVTNSRSTENTTTSHFTTDTSDTICDIDEFTLTVNSETTTEHESRCDTDCSLGDTFETVDYNAREGLSTTRTDRSNMLPDIDEFTLTITSESGRESASLVEHTVNTGHIPNKLQIVTTDDSDTEECDRKRYSPLRRESFLEAINNTIDKSKTESTMSAKEEISVSSIDNSNIESTMSEKEETSVNIESENEGSYFNYGYEKDSESEAKICGDEDGDKSKESNATDEENVNVVAYF